VFRKIVTGILLYCISVLACGCYTLTPYAPQQVTPDMEVSEVVKIDSSVVHFDAVGLVENRMVIGGIRNDFDEIKARRIPFDSVSVVRVRKMNMSTPYLVMAGLGAGLAAFVLIEILSQHRGKTGSGPIDNSETNNSN
jgi:hypothetical protein